MEFISVFFLFLFLSIGLVGFVALIRFLFVVPDRLDDIAQALRNIQNNLENDKDLS